MAMQFTRLPGGSHNDSKAAKFVLVAGLHVALGALFIHSINTKKISLPSLPDALQVKVEPERPSPPPTPALPATFVEPDPSPFPATPSAAPPEAPATPGTNSGNPGQMHTAVFADANGCALPDYPAAAARRGDSGTTTLALLVGTDGRVSSARVEHSSGSRDLDRAAINALSLCRFKPATSNGLAEAGWAKLAYVWKLD
jgi:protein TonB